jgi:phosphogluconate dehydratase
VVADLSANSHGMGREMFESFRRMVGTSETGAAVVI